MSRPKSIELQVKNERTERDSNRVLAKLTITISLNRVAISAMQLRNSMPRAAPLATAGISTVSWASQLIWPYSEPYIRSL